MPVLELLEDNSEWKWLKEFKHLQIKHSGFSQKYCKSLSRRWMLFWKMQAKGNFNAAGLPHPLWNGLSNLLLWEGIRLYAFLLLTLLHAIWYAQ